MAKSKEANKRYARSPKGKEAIRRANFKHEYGLPIEIKEQKLKEQGYGCANPGCSNMIGMNGHFDHNHETGKSRGVLCSGCNKSLGLLMESSTRIFGLAVYMLHWEGKDIPTNYPAYRTIFSGSDNCSPLIESKESYL